jgi:beta-phosphoglucomutase family hydrolase
MNQAVIFDMDGVIVLTEQAHWLSWQAPAKLRGITLSYSVFLSCFGRVNPDAIPILFGPGISAEESAVIAEQKEVAFRDIVRSNMPIAPGLIELLDALKHKGIQVSVGSSAPPENVNLVLDVAKIRHYFTAVVDGSQVKHGKPAPDVFLKAADLMKIPPARCSVIEDAPAGIKAAVAAGMRAVGVATTHKAEELLSVGANFCAPTLRDLSLDDLLIA